MDKFITKYLSQEVVGWNDDLSEIQVRCKVLYNDGSVAVVIESRPTKLAIDPASAAPTPAGTRGQSLEQSEKPGAKSPGN